MHVLSTTARAVFAAMLVVALTCDVGYAKMSWKPSKIFSMKSSWPFRDKDEPQEGTPTRVTCAWTDTVMSQPGKKSQRGFGGRLLFYEEDEKNPILVDGQLVVYAFDETGREPTDNKPTRRYVFPAEQMPLHMSKNQLGASYSFFLPWDEAGGPKTEVSLICRFEPKEGSVVSSEQTRQVLPGTIAATPVAGDRREPPKLPEGVPSKPIAKTLQSLQASRNEERTAKLASYEVPVAADPQAVSTLATSQAAAPARQMTSTTINLPNSFQMPAAGSISTQPTPHIPRQFVPSQQPMQPAAVPQAPVIRPFSGTQAVASMPALAPPVAYGQPANVPTFGAQTPTISQAMTVPPTQAMIQAPPSNSVMPNAQVPIGQQQVQQAVGQATLQQQLLQQQAMQQQLMQKRMLQQQAPMQQAGQQLPVQNTSAAMVNYPAAGQYHR
jgi:hypothetical protein